MFIFILISCLIYLYGTSTYNHWKKLGVVEVVKRKVPFFGHTFSITFSTVPQQEVFSEMYNSHPNERFVGFYDFQTPVLLIKDPTLIENVLCKDFSAFSNRPYTESPDNSILTKHLVNLENERWKSLRSKITPTFSPVKLKGMHQQLLECSENLLKSLEQVEGTPFEVRSVISRFTTDVIASCGFGIQSNTLNEPDSPFRQIGKKVFELSTLNKFRYTIKSRLGWLVRLLKWHNIPKELEQFFLKVVNDTIQFREENHIHRPDFLHLMNELKKNDENLIRQGVLSPDDPTVFDYKMLISNAFVFLAAGFETTATAISYVLYELALHKDIQESLFMDIKTAVSHHDGKLTFDAINEIKLLNQIFFETMRLHPPAISVSRISSVEYRVPGSDLVLPAGTSVKIPTYCLHHDPKYFPEPEKFQPNRFISGKKEEAIKNVYLPFGGGPRKCIASRFAELEVKVAVAKIVGSYRIVKCSKTADPLTYEPKAVVLVPKGGLWLSIEKRTNLKR